MHRVLGEQSCLKAHKVVNANAAWTEMKEDYKHRCTCTPFPIIHKVHMCDQEARLFTRECAQAVHWGTCPGCSLGNVPRLFTRERAQAVHWGTCPGCSLGNVPIVIHVTKSSSLPTCIERKPQIVPCTLQLQRH
eukprot:1156063-Pelagomonas_calceolata.AAC.7